MKKKIFDLCITGTIVAVAATVVVAMPWPLFILFLLSMVGVYFTYEGDEEDEPEEDDETQS